jgi:hypothetical protein
VAEDPQCRRWTNRRQRRPHRYGAFPDGSSGLRIVAIMLRVARPSIPPHSGRRKKPPGLPWLRAERELGPDYESRISRGRRESGRLPLGRPWC